MVEDIRPGKLLVREAGFSVLKQGKPAKIEFDYSVVEQNGLAILTLTGFRVTNS